VGRVLIIAYHFPPCTGSSGLLRTLKFSHFLPQFGWNPVVLTLQPHAYELVDERGNESIPTHVPVVRAFALDTKRHLGYRGVFLRWMALPDRWVTWLLGAVPTGLRAIRRHKVDVLFSTFPITTAVLVGLMLHRFSGKPWIVDLRDSMTEDDYPRNARERRVRRWIERQAMRCASRVIFTTPSARRMYLERYPHLPSEKCLVIPNGYDEDDFASLPVRGTGPVPAGRPLRLLHTGIMYPEERDPRPFFRALARLKRVGRVDATNLRICFRASGFEELYQTYIEELGIADLIELLPHVPYLQSLRDCAECEGLLLFQAASCDHQIPAKAYEYLRLQKPIFAMTTHVGDTGYLLLETGGATIVHPADEEEIHSVFPDFLAAVRRGTHPLAELQIVERYARRSQAEALAKCLDDLKVCKPVSARRKVENFES